MTWEWVVLISVALLCIVISGHIQAFRHDRKSKDTDVADLKLAMEKVVEVQNKITADMLKISETGEEAKKLLSEANLVAGFKPRGMR